MKKLLQPKILVPILLSVSLLAFVFSITDAPKVAGYLRAMSVPLAAGVFATTIGYMSIKWVQFDSFLDRLQLRVSWRQSMLAFVVGEMTLPVPAGIYAQNFVLLRITGADFSRSSGATTAVLVSEGAISLVGVLILGIPGWEALRYAILALFFVAAVPALVVMKVEFVHKVLVRFLEDGPFPDAGSGLIEIVRDTKELLFPTGFVRVVPVTSAYLLCLVAGFYLTAHGIGEHVDFLQAAAIYLFAIAIVLVSPVSAQLGIVEAGGVGAMQQFGYSPSESLAVMLGFRLLWTGSVWLVGGTVLMALRSELGGARRNKVEPSRKNAA